MLSLVSNAQTDTSSSVDSLDVYIDKDFSTFKSSLQFTIGQNLTIGDYGDDKTPFSDGFATTYNTYQLSVNAKYTNKIKEDYGFEVGAEFFRNVFDWRGFNDAYLQTTGDSMKTSDFSYEHFSVYAGLNYNLVKNRLMLSVSTGTGILYNITRKAYEEGISVDVIDFTPNGVNGYKGGDLFLIRGFQPLFYAGLNLKYYLGDEFYIVANSHFTYSLQKIRVTEEINSREERDYLNKSIAINNISLSLGVGTLF